MQTTDTRTTNLHWVKEDDPRWDTDRERVFATVPEGVFRTERRTHGERLSSDWWRVQDGDRVIGYGWLDDVWGAAEILLAVEEGARGTGAGAFALARLEEEAAARGLNYVVNVVRDTHPQRDAVTAWFVAHGFTGTEDGRLAKRVRDRADPGMGNAGRSGTEHTGEAPDDARRSRYQAALDQALARGHSDVLDPVGSPLGPGHEESGGYVDPEQHRY